MILYTRFITVAALSALLLSACTTSPFTSSGRTGAKLAPEPVEFDENGLPIYRDASDMKVSLRGDSDEKFSTEDKIDSFVKDTAYVGHPSHQDESAICYDYGHMIRRCDFKALPAGNSRDAANGPIPSSRSRRDIRGYAILTDRYVRENLGAADMFPIRNPLYGDSDE